MTNLKRWAWAVAVGAAFTGPAFAQTTGTTGTTTGGTTTGGGGQASPQSTIEIVQIETPSITSTTATGSGQGANVAASNAFGPYFANPAWQGRAGTNTGSVTTVVAPGGFGQALYGTAGVSGGAGAGGTGGANRTGTTSTLRTATGGTVTQTALGGATTGGRTTTTGGLGGTTTGGLGGTTGGRTTGGFGGAGTQQNTANQQLSTGRAVAYTQTIRFAAPPAPQGPQLTSDLQSMIASSSSLSSVAGLQVTAGDGGAVVLRGAVADADEKRLVEGMIRLTPGVKAVQNELTIK